jgi:hypothetical protein
MNTKEEAKEVIGNAIGKQPAEKMLNHWGKIQEGIGGLFTDPEEYTEDFVEQRIKDYLKLVGFPLGRLVIDSLNPLEITLVIVDPNYNPDEFLPTESGCAEIQLKMLPKVKWMN